MSAAVPAASPIPPRRRGGRLWWRDLAMVEPAEWRRRIDAIQPLSVRLQTACIVWWDFLSMSDNPKFDSGLRDLLDAWKPHDADDLAPVVEALVALGYPPADAAARMERDPSVKTADELVKSRIYNGNAHPMVGRGRRREDRLRQGRVRKARYGFDAYLLAEPASVLPVKRNAKTPPAA